MKVHCASCSSPIPADDIDLPHMIAKCRACDSVFSIEGPKLAPAPRRSALERPPPKGIEVVVERPFAELGQGAAYREPDESAEPGALTIRRRWFHPAGLFLLVFAIVWDSFLVFWYGIAFSTGGPLIMVIFPLGHVAAGVGITYFSLATLLNRTTIHADAQAITVTHRPVPWRYAGRVPVDTLERIYVDESATRRNGQAFFRVLAETRSEQDRVLVSGIPKLQAEHIAEVLREHLRVAS